MTEHRKPRRTRRFGEERRKAQEAEQRWRKAGYQEDVISRLRWDRRYSVVRIAGVQLAFSEYERFMDALRVGWEAGLVPEPGHGSVLGMDLPEVAPLLRGVDVDLSSHGLARPDPGSR